MRKRRIKKVGSGRFDGSGGRVLAGMSLHGAGTYHSDVHNRRGGMFFFPPDHHRDWPKPNSDFRGFLKKIVKTGTKFNFDKITLSINVSNDLLLPDRLIFK